LNHLDKNSKLALQYTSLTVGRCNTFSCIFREATLHSLIHRVEGSNMERLGLRF